MITIRIGSILFFAMIATSQQTAVPASDKSQPMATEPQLPVIDHDACPGKNRSVAHWKIKRKAQIYSSWDEKQNVIGALNPRDEVTVLAGVNVTRKPDRILVKRPISGLSVEPGDIILRYDYFGEGEANIWAKGIWHNHYDLPTLTEKNGAGCQSRCDSIVTEDGVKEWWVQVKTGSRQAGWVLATKDTGGVYWDSGNFDELCAD